MPGKITRLLACSAAQRAKYPEQGMQMGPTFVHPNFFDNPHNGESSGSYNKPAAGKGTVPKHFLAVVDKAMEMVPYRSLRQAVLDALAVGGAEAELTALQIAVTGEVVSTAAPAASGAAGGAGGGAKHVARHWSPLVHMYAEGAQRGLDVSLVDPQLVRRESPNDSPVGTQCL